MLKKNLIAIAIVMLGLVMASNAFGQQRPKRVNKNDKPKKADSIITPMYVANQEEYMAGGIADMRGGYHDRGEETTSRKKQTNSAASTSLMKDMFDGGGLTTIKGRTETVNNNETITKSNSQKKLGNREIQGISETNWILVDGIISPRDTARGQATGRRQYEPLKSKNLGDTGTHEVGHKQRKRGRN